MGPKQPQIRHVSPHFKDPPGSSVHLHPASHDTTANILSCIQPPSSYTCQPVSATGHVIMWLYKYSIHVPYHGDMMDSHYTSSVCTAVGCRIQVIWGSKTRRNHLKSGHPGTAISSAAIHVAHTYRPNPSRQPSSHSIAAMYHIHTYHPYVHNHTAASVQLYITHINTLEPHAFRP